MIFKFISDFKNKIENAELKLKKIEDELKVKAILFVKIVLAMLTTVIVLNIIILTILIIEIF